MLNSVSLIGRMTKDINMFQIGESVKGVFTLAVNRDYKDKDGSTPCDFLEIEVWNSSASFLEQYAGKGCMISVQGSIRLNTYEDKEGNTRYKTFVQGDRVNLLVTPSEPQEESKTYTAKPKKQTYQKKK